MGRRWEFSAASHGEGFVERPYYGELSRKLKAEGIAEGKAEGAAESTAKMLVLMLEQWGFDVTAAQRERVMGCADVAQLEAGAKRVPEIDTIAELLDES